MDDTGSVLVDTGRDGLKVWVDVWYSDNELVADWNQYIFTVDNERDQRVRVFQLSADNANEAFNVAINYYEENSKPRKPLHAAPKPAQIQYALDAGERFLIINDDASWTLYTSSLRDAEAMATERANADRKRGVATKFCGWRVFTVYPNGRASIHTTHYPSKN